jgi:hypothetical protein
MKPPKAVTAEVQSSWKDSFERRCDTWPQGNHITWTFPGNELTEGNEWTLEWFDGEFYPPKEVRELFSLELNDYPAESAMIVGSEGALLNGLGHAPVLLPEEKFKSYPRPRLRERNHHHHFVDACLGGEKTESHFAQTGPMTEAILLGTVAIRVPEQRLEWDAKRMKFPNYSSADCYLRRVYRREWEVPGVKLMV